MRKRLTRFIIAIVLILSGIYLLQRIHSLPSLAGIFKRRRTEIENTAILIREINSLAQLITITAYNEITIDSTKKGWALFNNPLIPTLLNMPNIKGPTQKLILVAKGKVLGGVNLEKLTDKDVFAKEDSVSVILPPAEILQVIVNPSGFEIFEEKGNWSDEEVKAVKIKAREKLVANALKQHILQKASAKAIVVMENFLRASGFKKVKVTIRP